MYTGVPSFLNGNRMRRGPEHHTIAAPTLPAPHPQRTEMPVLLRRRPVPRNWLADQDCGSVPGELDNVPPTAIHDQFIPAEPKELELSVIELADGESPLAVALQREVLGPDLLVDISGFGGWRDN